MPRKLDNLLVVNKDAMGSLDFYVMVDDDVVRVGALGYALAGPRYKMKVATLNDCLAVLMYNKSLGVGFTAHMPRDDYIDEKIAADEVDGFARFMEGHLDGSYLPGRFDAVLLGASYHEQGKGAEELIGEYERENAMATALIRERLKARGFGIVDVRDFLTSKEMVRDVIMDNATGFIEVEGYRDYDRAVEKAIIDMNKGESAYILNPRLVTRP